MSDTHVIKAESRTNSGKGAARRARAAGDVPAVIYGSKKDPENVTLNGHSLLMAMQAGNFFTNMQEVEIDGKKQKVLPRDVQRDPVFDKILHVDFLRFDPKREINVAVTLRVVGEESSPGIKKGGVVSLTRGDMEVICRADAIPNEIVVDVSGLDVGDSLHVSSVDLPEGVRPAIEGRDFTVASVLTTRSSKMDEDGAEGEATEGEEAEDAEGAEGDSSEETSNE